MSEGKPSGADQSTSNSGGGGDLGERIANGLEPLPVQGPTLQTDGQGTNVSEEKQGQERGLLDIVTDYFYPPKNTDAQPVWNLADQLEQLLYSPLDPRIASEDPELFQRVMNEFHTFEQGAYKQSAANQALQTLTRGCQQFFVKDFPLYIALSYRTSVLKKGLYRCDSLSKFVDTSVYLFGSLDASNIARTLKGFLSRGDFNFYCSYMLQQDADEKPVARWAFSFLKSAFGNLLGGLKLDKPPRIYPRMVWIATYLRFCLLKPDQVPPSRQLWRDHLLKEAHVYTMDGANVEGVMNALALSCELELPPKLTFDTSLMGELLAPDTYNKLRYFSHQRDAIFALEQYFTSGEEFLEHIVLRLRKQIVASTQKSKHVLKYLSANGSRFQAVKDGLSLLNSMLHTVNTKKWAFPLFEADMQQWLLFLLGLIDYTQKPQECLEELLSTTLPVVKKFKDFIREKIVEQTRESLRGLSVEQFFPLYKVVFRIWPCQLLEEYLDEYVNLPDVRFSDPTWKVLLHDAVQRFPGAANQKVFHRFFMGVAVENSGKSKASSFIIELLQVGVNGLFSLHVDDVSQDQEAVRKFDRDLRNFIAKNLPKDRLLFLIKQMMKCAQDKENSFQDVVLTAIHKEIIPGANDLLAVPMYVSAIDVTADILKKDPTWPVQKQLSVKQKFCLRFINTCCMRIPVSTSSFKWMTEYSAIISQIGSVFCSFSSMRKAEGKETLLSQSIPSDVSRNDLVIQYFDWIQKLHNMLSNWKSRLETETANYDEIFWYTQNQRQIHSLAQAVSADGVVVTAHKLSELRSTFLQNFEQLNVLLLRYISTESDPKGGWCSLIYVLSKYGLEIPLDIKSKLENSVVFPDEYEKKPDSFELLINPPTPCTNGEFSPHNELVHLWLTPSMGLSTLCALVEGLSSFLEPLKQYLGLIVYFELYPSQLFDTYIRHRLSDTISVSILIDALKHTNSLLQRVLNGTARYGEITAAGSLVLESLDIDGEFSTLLQCSRFTSCDTSGLTGMKNLLKLIQFVSHIQTINIICQQYHLENCKNDPELEVLNKIAKQLNEKEEKDKLTPEQANPFWQTVCAALCLKEDANSKSLELLSKVADSGDFFQFLEEKQFTGTNGSARFRQQFELITAQLQHEEYCDVVLNHLLAAFGFISPFLDRNHSLRSLMSSVAALELPEGLPQLETVKCNVHQIRYWFSRAEDTLENVSSELDDILCGGSYHVVSSSVSGRSRLHLMLEYESFRSISTRRPRSTSINLGTSAPIDIQYTGSQREAVKEKLSSAQIDDFVRQLGFLDAHKDEQRVQSFLHLHEVATRLLELFEKLKELGHPNFSQQKFVYTLECSASLMDADKKVTKAESTLTEWINKVEELHTSYKWLLFFRVPKLMILYDLLRADKPCISEIVQEIGFLFKRDAASRALLQGVVMKTEGISQLMVACHQGELSYVQVLLKAGSDVNKRSKERHFTALMVAAQSGHAQIVKKLVDHGASTTARNKDGYTALDFATAEGHVEIQQELLNSESAIESFLLKDTVLQENAQKSAMDVVGSFLDNIFSRDGVVECSLPMQCETISASQGQMLLSSPQMASTFHSAPGFTQGQLIRFLLEVYGGSPNAFQVLRCTPVTVEQDLRLFMKRVVQHSMSQYLILEVNTLPFQLQEVLLRLYLELRHKHVEGVQTCLHFIETAPSILREVPWLTVVEHREEASTDTVYPKAAVRANTEFKRIHLVYGLPGNGKTHYTYKKLKSISTNNQVTIAVNEAFSCISAIEKLCTLPLNATGCAIFFNFTMLPPVESAHEKEKAHYCNLMQDIGWFFFDLLILGYIEDSTTGKSFQVPDLSWEMYVEVPSRANMSAEDALEHFRKEIPTLGLLGSPHLIDSNCEYSIDDDVQLVCQYLKAYDSKKIDTLYKERGPLVKFSEQPQLPIQECKVLLQKYMPNHIKKEKITQKLFVKYMKRRCVFLDNFPAFNYNTGRGEYVKGKKKRSTTDTKHLGSTLMETMLKEVSDFCDPAIKESWSQRPHQQLIYDFKDGGCSLDLVSLLPDELSEQDKMKFSKIGVRTPSMGDLYSRALLDTYLSRALNVPLLNGRLSPIDERQYVLTLDYTLKMLNIHERYECGIPVIIEGETGVGKTALVGMLSQLWNHSWLSQWDLSKNRIVDSMKRKLGDPSMDIIDESVRAVCVEAVYNLSAGNAVSEDMLDTIGKLPSSSHIPYYYTVLNSHLEMLSGDPILSMLDIESGTLADAFSAITEERCKSKSTARLLTILFNAKMKTAFHKLNIHAAIQPKDIEEFFSCVFAQAQELQQSYDACDESKKRSYRVPFVTAYLDEINTASCLGLLKEIIIDRTIDGKPIPQNVFIIASCNPHRGDILAAIEDQEAWLKGTYYVRKLHPTLQFLMWDYGSLNMYQEQEYIIAKLEILNQSKSSEEVSLTDLIVHSQQKMREYAFDQLQALRTVNSQVAKLCAKSSVSQRDIQRVFTFYQWLMKFYSKFDPHKERREKYHRRAMMVSLGIVYFMRLNSKYRKEYQQYLDSFPHLSGEISFSQAIEDELKWFIEQVELPPNIAKTEALKENVFVTIACAVNHTPLIIVGDPGSSKTLSFNIAIANLKGKESRNPVFRDTDIFQSLDPHFYQCSRRTTSNEVAKVFIRAINRQQSLAKIPLPIYCVVFMDEAGLPEEKIESLKVLHYFLDRQEVSFVAISNHVLDAAKTNRAVSLFRPKAKDEELRQLAKENIVPAGQQQSELHNGYVRSFCRSYNVVVRESKFRKLFGLRDFIHFVTYLRCKRKEFLNHQLVLEALERNFNGTNEFKDLCRIFKIPIETLHFRSVLDILKDSLADRSTTRGDDIHNSIQSEVRYKLIIDPSEDDSLVRLLFTHGVLQRKSTRLYICSDFPGDEQLRVNTIAQIRHSVVAGHTILMCQTDEIHECFYDLFNQRFRSIEDPEHGTRYYTNIAIGAHSKPCRVHPNFQCVIVIKESEVQDTPAPFLNRFEKYYLTHKSLLQNALCKMPPCLRIMIEAAHNKAAEFVSCVKPSSLYGYTNETLDSLLLMMLPVSHKHQTLLELLTGFSDPTDHCDTRMMLLKVLLEMLQQNCGFHLPLCSEEELKIDVNHVYEMVLEDPEFAGVIPKIKQETLPALVDEALHVLHCGPEPTDKDTPFDIYTDALMVIAVLMQWLVGYLCTHLMQLMTPEALAVHCSSIPTAYIQKYLKVQQHFSLKDLVDNQLKQLQRNSWNSSVCPTKLLCFTRSSPFIHQLPSEYPSFLITESVTQHHQSLKKYIFSDLERLMLCKVSLGHSQHKLEKLLDRFVNSDCQLLLLIANMQEITKKMVNHLRIMIEEAENKRLNTNKLFVLLLHFPPVMFFSPCYPSLFLQGWGHHYLDTVASGTLTTEGVKAVVNIKEWFYYSCFPHSSFDSADDDHMVAALEELLAEAVPIITSRVSFIIIQNGTTSVMNASQRTQFLKQLLYEKKLGKLLVTKFRSYWTPKVMVEYIQKVPKLMYAQESTLNITDSIQSIIRSTFFDFLVYMFARTNQQLYLSTILDPDCPPVIEDLFLKLMPTIGVPDLTQLKVLCTTLRPEYQPNKVAHSPRFPFFVYIYDTLEKIIDESREEVNQNLNSLDSSEYGVEASSVTASICLTQMTEKEQMEKVYKEVVLSRLHTLEHSKKACLDVAVESMNNDTAQEIWKRYFEDFVHFKLHLESKVLPLTNRILTVYIGSIDEKDSLTRLVSLHVRLEVGQLDLGKLSRTLRPISRVAQEMETLTTMPDAVLTSITSMVDIRSVTESPETLGAFTVDILFTAISSLQEVDDEKINQWHRSYNDIMTMPSLEGDILSNLKPKAEAKLNIMHATYLVMQSCFDSTLSLQRGCQFFKTLHLKYFGVSRKDIAAVPRLCEIVHTGLATLDTLSPEQKSGSYCLQSFIEGLFAFFFSKHRVTLAEEDCQYFLELANQQHHICRALAQNPGYPVEVQSNPLFKCTSINVFKLYLSRILGESNPQKPSELLLHDSQKREMVGNVLVASPDLTSLGPYIPTFYQHRERNALMQQPLAHIYFLTVLEHLQMRGYRPNHLCRLAENITKRLQDMSSDRTAEKVLCFIEKQAVIQVLIQQVAALFDPKDPKKIQNLFTTSLILKVNPLLSDESFGGSSTTISGHGLMLALHLQRQLKSSRKLIEMFIQEEGLPEGTSKSASVRTIECTRGLQSLVKKQLKAGAHLLPFIDAREQTSEIGHLYQQIFQVMTKISYSEDSQLQSSSQDLIKLAQDSGRKMKFTTVSGHEIDISKRNAFRMSIWLCAYYEFFLVKENHSQKLADEIYNCLRGILEPEFIGLLQSFIYPKNMIKAPESPPDMDENAVKFALTDSLHVLQLQTAGEKRDPIFELFNPPANSKQDPSDVELCHAVVNMVAVVLACKPRSNHLWYHMFAADELAGSYMTGFMYEGKITEGRLYDCGVELSSDGTYGRPDYLPHATRGTLSLHSLYFLLWANFGSFCMALLTQPDAQQRISGPVISKWQAIRHYCVMQLRSVWLHMGNKLKISPEEQSFLTLQSMHNLLEICTRHPQPCCVFSELTELDRYETMWHTEIFTPGHTNIHTKFAEHCQLWEHNALLKEVSDLEAHYPHFPTLDECFQTMLSSVNISDTKNELFALSKFALEYPRLEAAGALLPELLEFYRWIHIELAYRVTFKYAENHTIQELIEKADEEYKRRDMKETKGFELPQLYEKVKAGYNKYVEVVGNSIGAGACANIKRDSRLFCIKDDTKFLHFLSDTENEGEGNDWLYIVIADMINFHNSFLQSIFDAVDGTNLRAYFPENLDSHIYPNEVNEHNMIIGKVQRAHGIEEQLQLVRSRHMQAIDGQTQDRKLLFNLPRLQKDIIKAYLSGKPKIEHSPEHVRIPFKFRAEASQTVSLGGADLDLSVISEYIRPDSGFRVMLDRDHIKAFECEFHSADYNKLVEVVTGLRNATEHLIKSINLEEDHTSMEQLKQIKLPDFLLHVFNCKQSKKREEIINDIGIKSLSRTQLSCIVSLELPYLYCTLELFVQWINEGVYDFHDLPLRMKKHLEAADEDTLNKLHAEYTDDPNVLLQELQSLTEVLVHSQSHLRKHIDEHLKKSIIMYLRELSLFGEEQLAKLIPESVLCQHYVALRISLRRHVSQVQSLISARSHEGVQGTKWVEFIQDLWTEEKLKHLRDVAMPYGYDDHLFQFDPATQLYGFQEGTDVEEESFLFIHTDYPSSLQEASQSLVDSAEETSQPASLVEQRKVVLALPITEKETLEAVAASLTVDDVAEFLVKWKLQKCEEVFRENDVDGALLLTLGEDDLQDLGVAKGFDRRKIISKFKQHLQEVVATS